MSARVMGGGKRLRSNSSASVWHFRSLYPNIDVTVCSEKELDLVRFSLTLRPKYDFDDWLKLGRGQPHREIRSN